MSFFHSFANESRWTTPTRVGLKSIEVTHLHENVGVENAPARNARDFFSHVQHDICIEGEQFVFSPAFEIKYSEPLDDLKQSILTRPEFVFSQNTESYDENMQRVRNGLADIEDFRRCLLRAYCEVIFYNTSMHAMYGSIFAGTLSGLMQGSMAAVAQVSPGDFSRNSMASSVKSGMHDFVYGAFCGGFYGAILGASIGILRTVQKIRSTEISNDASYKILSFINKICEILDAINQYEKMQSADIKKIEDINEYFVKTEQYRHSNENEQQRHKSEQRITAIDFSTYAKDVSGRIKATSDSNEAKNGGHPDDRNDERNTESQTYLFFRRSKSKAYLEAHRFSSELILLMDSDEVKSSKSLSLVRKDVYRFLKYSSEKHVFRRLVFLVLDREIKTREIQSLS